MTSSTPLVDALAAASHALSQERADGRSVIQAHLVGEAANKLRNDPDAARRAEETSASTDDAAAALRDAGQTVAAVAVDNDVQTLAHITAALSR